jgi:hypothetical protein
MTKLIPAQESAYRILKYAFDAGGLLLLMSHTGRGRTTILRKLQEETGGGFVTAREFIETSVNRHPLSLEETLYSAVAASLRENKIVYVDDIDLIHEATSSCHFYPRGQYLETAMLELSDWAQRDGKKLVVSTDGSIAQNFAKRSFTFFRAQYRSLGRSILYGSGWYEGRTTRFSLLSGSADLQRSTFPGSVCGMAPRRPRRRRWNRYKTTEGSCTFQDAIRRSLTRFRLRCKLGFLH